MYSNLHQLNTQGNKKKVDQFSFKLYYWLLKKPSLISYQKKLNPNMSELHKKMKSKIDIFLLEMGLFKSLKEIRYLAKTKNAFTINGIKISNSNHFLKKNDLIILNPNLINLTISNWKLNSMRNNQLMKKTKWNVNSGYKNLIDSRTQLVPEVQFNSTLALPKVSLKNHLFQQTNRSLNNFIFDWHSWSFIVL